MKIYALRIGDKYGPEYETYIKSKLKDYDLTIVNEPFDPRVALQWNKMFFMALDIDEPICVIDIDLILINDYKKIFDYPIKKGQFLGMRQWWDNTDVQLINGGFFKYYPTDCKYIFDKFMSNIEYWQSHYIEKGVTVGPVNGEQNFVEESVKERLELITFSDKWCTRWTQNPEINKNLNNRYFKYFHEPMILGGEFNVRIKMVHFTYSLNKPHESKMFKHLYT